MTDAATTQSSGTQQAQQASATQGASDAASTTTQTQAATPTRPEWLPEPFFDAKAGPKWEDFGKHFQEVATRDAAEQVRRAQIPKPEDYKVAPSAAFKPPAGIEYKIDEANPIWAQARAWANRTGLTQDQFHEAIDLFAGNEVSTQQKVAAARDAEIAKLGATGSARVTAVNTWLDGMGVGELKARIFTAKDVENLERLITKVTTQGAASFSQSHREPAQQGGKVTQEQYDKMSAAQRLDYVRQFDQRQFYDPNKTRAA